MERQPAQFKNPYSSFTFDDKNQRIADELTAASLPAVQQDAREIPIVMAKQAPSSLFPVHISILMTLALVCISALSIVLLIDLLLLTRLLL